MIEVEQGFSDLANELVEQHTLDEVYLNELEAQVLFEDSRIGIAALLLLSDSSKKIILKIRNINKLCFYFFTPFRGNVNTTPPMVKAFMAKRLLYNCT